MVIDIKRWDDNRECVVLSYHKYAKSQTQSQISIWVANKGLKNLRNIPTYEYLEADNPPSGPWALRRPNSKSLILLMPAAMRYRAAFVVIKLKIVVRIKFGKNLTRKIELRH